MKRFTRTTSALIAACLLLPGAASASSHMDAPLITLDDAANTTDVYAFVSQSGGVKYLTTALAVYPFEEPGIGPNKYNFDDNVLYEIHVATGGDVARGRATYSFQFRFDTKFRSVNTILQSYLGVVNAVVRPVIVFLTLPITIVTLGLFLLVINAAMLALVAWLLDGFHIAGFWSALFGAVVVSITGWAASWFVGPRGHIDVVVVRGQRP